MNFPSFTPSPQQQAWIDRTQRLKAEALRVFHVYASWLVSISWKRFVMLAVATLIGANILQHLPPFNWKVSEEFEIIDETASREAARKEREKAREAARQKAREAARQQSRDTVRQEAKKLQYEIKVDERGIVIAPVKPPAAASAASSAASAASTASDAPAINIEFPKDASRAEIEQVLERAKEQLSEFKRQAAEAQHSAEEAERARQEAAEELAALAEAGSEDDPPPTPTQRRRVAVVRLGDLLVDIASLWVLASAVIKALYKGRMQAEVKAARATETAEAESLKRQVIEARMAAMQAQVEPHFLFNTLASIDHLIETDPPRASQMQRNLIALLRASMPTMREANASGTRDLGRELAVIRPYLEILKVRMEERLLTAVDVPEGLLSAEFPPMMIQGLVENAIKHGLEPKAEGGSLTVKAEVVHGKLAVTVADTGLGFGRAATSGTGVGLANIRERLQLLYGGKASVTVTENQPSGTVVTITVPYRSREADAA
ncbi:histidine kinase [Roseateles paludis]|uniref:histidine kinase n=1 Tax=Roseateles paludis TaxID=3145238 RepID=A0ABV0FVG7_9BURK